MSNLSLVAGEEDKKETSRDNTGEQHTTQRAQNRCCLQNDCQQNVCQAAAKKRSRAFTRARDHRNQARTDNSASVDTAAKYSENRNKEDSVRVQRDCKEPQRKPNIHLAPSHL